MDAAKILIVEDNTTVAEDIRETLENLGYVVTAIAASGEEAAERAGADRPDAVLMDIRLRGKVDGVDAAEKIHNRFEIPALFLSAYSDRDLLRRAKSAGSFGYLVKPFEERELAAMLEMTLYKAGVEKERRRMAEQLKESEQQLKQYSERLEEMVAERTRALEAAQAELLVKERLAVLGHFAGSVSHELRNPLAVIESSAYLLNQMSADADDKLKKHMGKIRDNVRKSNNIIESLINLSRMEKPKTEKHDLTHVVSMSLDSSRIPETVNVRLNPTEKGVPVHVDPEQIRMALKNIIQNALQAMEGSGELSLSVQASGDGSVELTVADTGPGIPPENLGKVFDPLFSTKTHGIGFGLSITKMILENHGGGIRAESEPGSGAVFIITFPHAGSP